jgi:ligand-binding sensor domain-containing protein
MWVATGNAGIHRFRNDTWTWFQPMSKTGPGFYEIDSMALDSASDALVIATNQEGLWLIRSPSDPVNFTQISPKDGTYGLMQHVRRDPLGGVYFFDTSAIVHYSVKEGFVPTLTNSDLAFMPIAINDIAAGQDGKLYLATDDGIYIWQDGSVVRHLTKFEGIGTSGIVKTIFVDAESRVWFATQDYVGYYQESQIPEPQIPIEMVTSPGPGNMSWTLAPTELIPAVTTQVPKTDTITGFFNPILDPIIRAINDLASHFGFKLFP